LSVFPTSGVVRPVTLGEMHHRLEVQPSKAMMTVLKVDGGQLA
jgi:hypothetical protein